MDDDGVHALALAREGDPQKVDDDNTCGCVILYEIQLYNTICLGAGSIIVCGRTSIGVAQKVKRVKKILIRWSNENNNLHINKICIP